jgi:serine/threonine protein kinase
MTDTNPFEQLNDEQLRVLHYTSEAFERSVRAGQPTNMEPYLESVPMSLRAIVFRELLAIETDWLQSQGVFPNESRYVDRFPEYQADIRELLTDESEDSSATRSNVPKVQSPERPIELLPSGTVIDGRYTIVKLIGEGGMGSVYLAEQHQPVTRQVAIKFIKGGMDSKAVQDRFDIERRSLALMDHPGIARVYDGGQTANGLSYFAMELVHGVPITAYCDQRRLSLRSRLELFVAICKAVQHAHGKGIIHRDLKPGNILVTEVDGRPVPKVIDFGVAKATDLKLSQQSHAVSLAMIVGTPAYMSPEQAEPGSNDIDIRTDVYALGVIMYELLAGSPPHDAGSLPRGAIFEALRMVRETDSPRPSTKVNDSLSLSQIAANRSIEPARLARTLRGELDWITLKALEKDRSRRYETAYGLARDVERYLSGDVVEARPPSARYRLRKFVQRYKTQVGAACLLFLTMTIGIAGTTWGLFQANKHALATQRELIAKEEARKNEAAERKHAEAIADFVIKDFLALTTLEGRLDFDEGNKSNLNKDSTLPDLLARAAEKLKTRNDLEPKTKASLLNIVGQSYMHLGEYAGAIDAFERSKEILANTSGSKHIDTLSEQGLLIYALCENGQYDVALPMAEELLQELTALLGSGSLETLRCKRMLARLVRMAGNPPKAVGLLEESIAGLTTLFGPYEQTVLSASYDLGLALKAADEPQRATEVLEKTHALQEEHLGQQHPDVHVSGGQLAALYSQAGQFDKATPLLEKGLSWSIENYGAEHPSTIYSMAGLAANYRNQQQLDKSIPMFEQVLELTRQSYGDEHPNLANALTSLAMAYRADGKHEKALPLFEDALAKRIILFGESHPATLSSKVNLAACLNALGQSEKSLLLNEECLKLATEILGEKHSTTVTIKQNIAVCYYAAKRLELSVPLFEDVLVFSVEKYGRTHPSTLLAIANMGLNYRDAGRLEESLPLLEEAYLSIPSMPSMKFVGVEYLDGLLRAGQSQKGSDVLEALLADARKDNLPGSVALAKQLVLIGSVLLRSSEFALAEPILRECVAIRQQEKPDEWSTFNAVGLLGECLLKEEKPLEAEPLLTTAIAGMQLHLAEGPKDASARRETLIDTLAELLESQGRVDDAANLEALRELGDSAQ